jgi:hypothetical protein
MGKTIGFKALHPPPFMVNANEQLSTQGFDLLAQSAQLFFVVPVPSKQNHPTRQGVQQSSAIVSRQCQSINVQ